VAPKWRHVLMDKVLDEPRSRITTRVPNNVRETLEQAAELVGSTVNQFMVQSAYQEAQRIVERETIIRLSQEQARQIIAIMENPPKPNKYLKAAVKQYKKKFRA
jgi:uncharacterized protein (DUF1778 family)